FPPPTDYRLAPFWNCGVIFAALPAPMKTFFAFVLVLFLRSVAFGAETDAAYALGPDSLPREGVPRGKIIGPETLPSKVFTNTTRHYWIYVPAQYQSSKPANLMIFQ